MKKNLSSDATVRNLEVSSKPYYCMSENKAEKGFGVLVYPSGSMTFVFKYKIDGVQKLLTLGEYPATTLKVARDEYVKAASKVKDLRKGSADGADPVADKKRKSLDRVQEAEAERKEYTFNKLAGEYIADNVEGQLADKSVYDIKRVLLGAAKDGAIDDFKAWRQRKASSITSEDVATLLKNVTSGSAARKGSAAAARNIIKTCRPMFAYGLPRGIVKTNPFVLASVKSFLSRPIQSKLEPTIKNRTLSEGEIKHLWKSLPTAKGSAESKNSLRMILLTGQRPSEVLGLHPREIKENWWTLPKERTKARLDKNREDHTVYLVPEALKIIGNKTGYYFAMPVKEETKADKTPADSKAVTKEKKPIAINALGHMLRANNYFGLPPWGAHDLRRTVRTFMSDIDGITTNAAEAILNHAKEGTKKNYDHHKYQRQIENALTLWRDKLVAIVGEPLSKSLSGKIVSIQSGKRKAA